MEHRPGKNHGNADGLSRRPSSENSAPGVEDTEEETEKNTDIENQKRVMSVSKEKTQESCSWIPRATEDEIRQAQRNDEVLAPLIESVRAGERPPSSEIQGSSRSTHVMWSNWSRLVIENDILYRRWESEDGTRMKLQLVVPKSLVPEILKLLHHNPTSGHLGVTKTVERVRQRFF